MPVLLKDIRQKMRQFPRDPRQYPALRIRKGTAEALPSPGTKSLTYRGIIEGETDDYLVMVQFFGIEFSDTKDSAHPLEVNYENAENGKIFYSVPSVGKNEVMIRCSCPDYRFRFEKPNYDAGALIGRWRPYTRKTPAPPVGYPYTNPFNLPGFCKHVYAFLSILNRLGRVRE